ncbi:MAG: class I SAM-dependent methyltransferase [Cyanobium sp.]
MTTSGQDPTHGPCAAQSPPVGATAPGGYDLIVQQLIPGYASLARLAVSLLAVSPRAAAPGAAVLVAGCGTGAELLEARSQRPDWHLTAIDPSAAMLAAAQERLQALATPPSSPPIDWIRTTVEELLRPEGFDGALSVLVLQSLADDGSKLAFLSSLARSLRPGGQLVLVDLMRPERSPLQTQVEEAWSAFQRASGVQGAAEALAGLSPHLHPIGLSRLTALAAAVGFSDPAPVFQALDFQGFLLQRQG